MNVKRMAAILAVVVAIAMFIPVTAGDASAEELEDGTVSISLVDGGTDITVDIDSGSSESFTVFVINNSNLYLGISIDVADIDDIEVETTQSTDILYPADSDGTIVATLTVTITTDEYASTGTDYGTVVIRVTDLQTDAYSEYTLDLTMNVTSIYTSGDAYNKFFGIIPNTLSDPFDSIYVTAILTIIIYVLVTLALCEIVVPLVMRLLKDRKTPEEKKELTKSVTWAMTLIMFIVSLNQCTQILGLSAETSATIGSWSAFLYIIILMYLVWVVYKFIITAVITGVDDNTNVEGLDTSLIPLFEMIGKLVIGVFGICAAMAALGVDLAGMLISAGVITLGITLGAQSVLGQFFSGIVLLMTRPFKEGDFVQLNGTTYIVRKVKLMNTEFSNWDGDQIIVIPNDTVTSSTIVNCSKKPVCRIFVYVEVAYGTNLDVARTALLRAGNAHEHVIKDGSVSGPDVRVTNFNGSGIELRLACYVDSYDSSGSYAGQIRELVVKEFDADDIEIPYSRIEIDVLADPESKEKARRSAESA